MDNNNHPGFGISSSHTSAIIISRFLVQYGNQKLKNLALMGSKFELNLSSFVPVIHLESKQTNWTMQRV